MFNTTKPAAPEKRFRRKLCISGTFPYAEKIQVEAIDSPNTCAAYMLTGFATELLQSGHFLTDDRYHRKYFSSPLIGVLIGSDYYWAVVGNNRITSSTGLCAISSKVGWILHGPLSGEKNKNGMANGFFLNSMSKTCLLVDDWNRNEPQRDEDAMPEANGMSLDHKDDSTGEHNQNMVPTAGANRNDQTEPLDRIQTENEVLWDLRAFWSLEHMGILDAGGGTSDPDPLADYSSKIIHTSEGRYQAPLPWKRTKELLRPNRAMAEGRLASLLVRLRRSPDLLAAYHNQMKEFVSKQFVGIATPNYEGIHTYLPHHPVVRTDKTTTRVRPVFDGSAKTKISPSINECLETGSNNNRDLLAVLLRFRLNRVAWIADVEKAFLQVQLMPEDSEAIRFLCHSHRTNY